MEHRTLIAALLVCLALSGCAPSPPPRAVFSTLDGEQIDLQTLRGAPVVVNFWSVTCAPCLRDMPQFAALHRELEDTGVHVVGVSMDFDPPHLVVQRVRGSDVGYPVSLDLRGEIATGFGGVTATPTTFVLDAEGDVVMRHTGSVDFVELRDRLRALLRGA